MGQGGGQGGLDGGGASADFDVGELLWPSNITEGVRVLPGLTTPADDPAGRKAPRSIKGRVDSATQARWLEDGRRYAPWHYEQGNMWRDRQGQYCLAPAEIKEQCHHLPKGWTKALSDHQRHKARHLGVARWFFILGLFAARVNVSTASSVLRSPSPTLGAGCHCRNGHAVAQGATSEWPGCSGLWRGNGLVRDHRPGRALGGIQACQALSST